MNDIRQRKINALNELFNSYEIYKGNFRSRLEMRIENLVNILNEEDFEDLYSAYKDYQNYLFEVLARSPRVFIKLNEFNNSQNNEDLNNLFKPPEEI